MAWVHWEKCKKCGREFRALNQNYICYDCNIVENKREKTMNFNFKIEELEVVLPEMEIRVYGYSPARPAPMSSNPDSPRFSDPGDDEYYEFEIFMIIREGGEKKYILMPEGFAEWLHEFISSDITEQANG